MSAEAYVLRRSTRADAAPVWSLRNKAIRAGCRGHYPAAELAKWCAGEYTAAWVQRVTDSGQVICAGGVIVASGMLDTHKGQIDALFVASQRIRSGLGRKMLKHIERLARQAGLKRVYLQATLNAVPFYRACGFSGATVARYKSFSGVVLDCVPMQRILD